MRQKRSMEEPLLQLRSGEITGNEFVKATSRDFDNLTRVTFRRWDLPRAVEPEDVRQELYLKALEPKPQSGKTLLEKWDPAKCAKLSRYVVFNAMADTSKVLKRQRENGKYPLAFSSLGEDADEDRSDEGEVAEREESRLNAKLLVRSASRKMSRKERLALRVLLKSDGDVEEASQAIEASVPLSIACDVGSIEDARLLLHTVMQRVRDVSA